jgi:hypothetical protein
LKITPAQRIRADHFGEIRVIRVDLAARDKRKIQQKLLIHTALVSDIVEVD